MTNTKIALITTIENKNNKNNVFGNFKVQRDYEKEAIECFKHWRKNGGWLKDIPIYTHCPTKNTISDETIKELKKLNVTYDETYIKSTEEHINGFINVYATGKHFENLDLDIDIFIHIDLDMKLIKELPSTLFMNLKNDNQNIIKCGVYTKSSLFNQRNSGTDLVFDTGFIISRKDSNFYNYFYDKILEFIKNPDENYLKIKESRKNLPITDYDIEEYFLDKLVYEEKLNVTALKNYQLGEGYPSIKEFSDDELKEVYFWHEHLYYDKSEYDAVKEKIQYKKRMNKLKDI